MQAEMQAPAGHLESKVIIPNCLFGPLPEALAVGDRTRAAYYEGHLRLISNSRAMLALSGAMNQHQKNFLDMDAATKALDEASFDGTAIARESIEHGVLTRNVRSELSFGIPSFHSYRQEWLDSRQRRT